MILPFWNSKLYVEISSWFPFGRDYQPVSVNRFHDWTLKSIAGSCLDLDSEFFFAASPLIGCVGNLPRENFFRYSPDNIFNLGFLIILGFSEKIEKAVLLSLIELKAAKGLLAGITSCSLWSRGIFHGTSKVIAIASEDPFYDGTEYLEGLATVLYEVKKVLNAPDLSYYAEKFGYDRFFIQWENDSPYDIRISQLLSELEYDSSKEIIGGSSRIDFPAFFGISVSAG